MPPMDPEAKISCPTPQHLQAELESLADILALGEKEETWDKMEKALIRFAGVTRGGGYKHIPLYTEGMGRKGCASKVAECMLSDRGRLSTAAVELLQAFAPRLGPNFAPIVQPYFESLLKLFARPNKVFLKRSERCLVKIIENCQLPNIVLELRKGLTDDAATCRRICSAGIERTINEWEHQVWTEKSLICLEEALRRMATDKDAEVRQTGKRVWAKFTDLWPERVDDFSAPLTPTIRRYLNLPAGGGPAKKSKPNPPARAAPSAPVAAPSAAGPSSRPQPLRVVALTHQPSRGAHRPHPQADSRHVPPAAPAPKQSLPEKAVPSKASTKAARDNVPVAIIHLPSDASSSIRHNAAPLHPGRSASHAALPTVSSFSSLVDQAPSFRPHRPVLPQSFSTTALPSESSTSTSLFAYTGRFATGPVRIVRPAPPPIPDESESASAPIPLDGEMVPFTPINTAAYGGPTRPPRLQTQSQVDIGHGHNRRPLGGAARRVVTAPSDTVPAMGMPIKTPAAGKTLSRSASQNAGASSPQTGKVVDPDPRMPAPPPRQAIAVTPSAPVAAEVESEAIREAESSSPEPSAATPLPTSPLLAPASAVVEVVRETETPEIPLNEELDRIRTMEGPVPVEVAAQIPLPLEENIAVAKPAHLEADKSTQANAAPLPEMVTVAENLDIEEEAEKAMEKDIHIPETNTQVEIVPKQEEEVGSPPDKEDAVSKPTGPTPKKTNAETLQTEADVPLPAPCTPTPVADRLPIVSTASIKASLAAPVFAPIVAEPAVEAQPAVVRNASPLPALVVQAPKPAVKAAPPIARVAPVSVPSRTAPIAALSRKPAVPRAADLGRRPVERKPFRPATAAQTAAASVALAKSREAAKPPTKTADLATAHSVGIANQPRQVSSSSAGSSRDQSAPSTASQTAVPVPRPAKPSSLLAPTKASAMRAVSNTHAKPAPGPSTTTVPSSSALPPVRKERVKLKPALPSFRPTRSGAPPNAPSRSISGPAALTSRSTSSAATRRPVARVKPESIPLPHSPAEKAGPVKSSFSSPLSKTSNASSGRVRVRPEDVALPPTPSTTVLVPLAQAESIALPPSPTPASKVIVEAVVQAAQSAPTSTSAPLCPTTLPLPSSPILASATSTALESISTPLRPASAAQTVSAVDSDSEDDSDDDLTGLTFKVRADATVTTQQVNRPRVVQTLSAGEVKAINLSAIDKLAGTTTPKYTPGRKALGSRDANVRSPLVMLSSASAEQED